MLTQEIQSTSSKIVMNSTQYSVLRISTSSLACPLARLVHKYTGLDIKSEMHAFMSIPSKQQKIWRDIHMCCDQSGSFNAMSHRHLGRSVYTLRAIIDRCPFAVIQGHLMASATIEM